MLVGPALVISPVTGLYHQTQLQLCLPIVHLHLSSQVPIKPPLLSMSDVRSCSYKMYTNSQDLCCPCPLLLTLVPTTTCVSATSLQHYVGTSWCTHNHQLHTTAACPCIRSLDLETPLRIPTALVAIADTPLCSPRTTQLSILWTPVAWPKEISCPYPCPGPRAATCPCTWQSVTLDTESQHTPMHQRSFITRVSP